MSVVITFHPKGGVKAYQAAIAQLESQNEDVQLHRSAHYASGTDEDFQVVDVWNSIEDFNDFADVLLPVLDKARLDPGVAEMRPLVNTIESGVARLDDIGLDTWNQHDPMGWVELFADEFTLTDPNMSEVITTRAEALGYVQSWLTTFPDMHVDQLDRVVSDHRVAAVIEFTGTHTGPLVSPTGATLAPTGRRVRGSGTYVATADDEGKIVSFAVRPDVLGMMLQLGVALTGE
jgi:predicted ester cyclase